MCDKACADEDYVSKGVQGMIVFACYVAAFLLYCMIGSYIVCKIAILYSK